MSASYVRFLIAIVASAIFGYLLMHSMTFHHDLGAGVHLANARLDALEKRSSALDEAASSRNAPTDRARLDALEKRFSALDEAASSRNAPTERAPVAQTSDCSEMVQIDDFTSREAMQRNGWELNVDSMEPAGGAGSKYLLAWGGGTAPGSMHYRFNVSGRLLIDLYNPFEVPDKENQILVMLNQNQIAETEQSQHTKLCLQFQGGDVLSMSEKYAQIEIHRFTAVCNHAPRQVARATTQCNVGRAVRVRPLKCDASDGEEGVIRQVLSSRRAVVKLGAPSFSTRSVRPEELFFQPEKGEQLESSFRESMLLLTPTLQCESFTASAKKNRMVGLIIITTQAFRHLYAPQLKTIECYAQEHDYDYFVLQGSDFGACDGSYEEFFFNKHCLIAEFLRQQKPDYVAVVLDADVVAGVLNRGLEQWLAADFDLQFYTRMGTEVAAGNYIARNRPWTIDFLKRWSNFYFEQPKGYSSADNGAIHIAILEALHVGGHEECRKSYANLVSLLSAGPEYWKFVGCFRAKFEAAHQGDHRSNYSVKSADGKGSIALLPEEGNWVVDKSLNPVFLKVGSHDKGPVFVHGVKGARGQTGDGALQAVQEFFENPDLCMLGKL